MRFFAFLLLAALMAGCAGSSQRGAKRPGGRQYTLEDLRKLERKFRYDVPMADSSYGHSEDNPINTAFRADTSWIMGPVTERFYLDHLTTEDGRPIRYRRLGSCCFTAIKDSPYGPSVPLDKYEIEYEGQTRKTTLYLNMYAEGDVHAPVGFRLNRLEGIEPAP